MYFFFTQFAIELFQKYLPSFQLQKKRTENRKPVLFYIHVLGNNTNFVKAKTFAILPNLAYRWVTLTLWCKSWDHENIL